MAFICTRELEDRVRTHRFEHVVQRTTRHRGLGLQEEALVDQTSRCEERFVASRPRNPHDRQGPPRPPLSETPRQHAQTAEHALLVRGQQLITPSDSRIDCLLAFGEIARAGGREKDIVHESAEQVLGGQHFDPRCRQLERERQCVEPSTNRAHRGAV